ncbi:MBL fold metallo-hydrolase [Enterocloster citroniae]|uniref:MBL fold metallo-hydrolase n=1 Tax=Enterocloster citroniae TaxID=358743 RepID=UPI001FA6EA8E|nr:MBL fold metallo-hydrolase [Enterocloster citroniae]
MTNGMEIMFWGTRGSMAAPYPDRMRYGGNTSCVSAKWRGGLVVFDGGTGICELGNRLLNPLPGEELCPGKELHIFITHLHLDHIMGLPFFTLLFQQNWKIHFYGESRAGAGFRNELLQISQAPYWPISFEQAAADIIWHEISPGDCIPLPEGAKMQVTAADHPNGSSLFRLEADSSSVVYGLDGSLTDRIRGSYEPFVSGCDLLIFDGMYTDPEYSKVKDFGHSTWQQGVTVKQTCHVGVLCISHHDWARTDAQLDEIQTEMEQIEPNAVFAREGMKICLGKEGTGIV